MATSIHNIDNNRRVKIANDISSIGTIHFFAWLHEWEGSDWKLLQSVSGDEYHTWTPEELTEHLLDKNAKKR